MSLTTIAHYDQTALAHIAQAKLEAEGIDSVVFDENVANWFWHCNVATGGVKLQVNEEDVLQACEILQTRDEQMAKVSVPVEAEPPRCPKCQSEHVQRRRLFTWPVSILSIVATVLITVFLGFLTLVTFLAIVLLVGYWRMPRWQCDDCGHCWKSS